MVALLLHLLLLVAPSARPPVITPADAAKHVGDEVVVQGVVDQVSVSTRSETAFLNFGGRYPNHTFNAVIFRAEQPKFPGLKTYEGKAVQVRGVVIIFRGKPEIILDEPAQLRLAE